MFSLLLYKLRPFPAPSKNMNYFYNKAAENRTKVKELTDGRIFSRRFPRAVFAVPVKLHWVSIDITMRFQWKLLYDMIWNQNVISKLSQREINGNPTQPHWERCMMSLKRLMRRPQKRWKVGYKNGKNRQNEQFTRGIRHYRWTVELTVSHVSRPKSGCGNPRTKARETNFFHELFWQITASKLLKQTWNNRILL